MQCSTAQSNQEPHCRHREHHHEQPHLSTINDVVSGSSARHGYILQSTAPRIVNHSCKATLNDSRHCDAHYNIRTFTWISFIALERPYTKQQQRDEGSNSPQPVGCNVGARNLHEVYLLQQASMTMVDRFVFDISRMATTARFDQARTCT